MIQRFYSNSVRINSSLFFLLGWLFHSVSFGQEPTLPAVTETVLQADAPTLVVVNGEEVARLRDRGSQTGYVACWRIAY